MTSAMPPIKAKPPTPPTTPPIIFFDADERPELDEPEASLRLGDSVDVAKPVVEETTLLDVTATAVG